MSVDEVFRYRLRISDRSELEAAIAEAKSRVARDTHDPEAHIVGEVYRARRRRDSLFGEYPGLFGEPSWDILLDLYQAQLDGERRSVSDTCLGSACPTTTGLRHVRQLEKAGLIRREPDPNDARRSHLSITTKASALMALWVQGMSRALVKQR